MLLFNTFWYCLSLSLSPPLPPSHVDPSSEIQVMLDKNGSFQLQPSWLGSFHSPLLLSTSSARKLAAITTTSLVHCSDSLGKGPTLLSSSFSSASELVSVPLWCHAGFSGQASWTFINSLSPVCVHPVLYSPGFHFPKVAVGVGKAHWHPWIWTL